MADPVALPSPGSVVVNEVMSNPSTTPGDMIELYNTTSQPINIGDWYLSNHSSDLTAYQIASGHAIAADGYYVLPEDTTSAPSAWPARSGLPGALRLGPGRTPSTCRTTTGPSPASMAARPAAIKTSSRSPACPPARPTACTPSRTAARISPIAASRSAGRRPR